MLKRWAAWPPGIRWLAGIAAVVLAAAIVWALFVPLADWLARHDVGSAKPALLQTARDAARGRLLTLVAGLFAAGALVFTALNFTLSRRTFELTEQGQVTDRYTKAIEQLGSDKLDVRIGGIYALERIARDSAKDHPTVMEVLTAFIREHSREPWPPADAGQPGTRTIDTARRSGGRHRGRAPGCRARHRGVLTSPARTSPARTSRTARTSAARPPGADSRPRDAASAARTSRARSSAARTSAPRPPRRGPHRRGPHRRGPHRREPRRRGPHRRGPRRRGPHHREPHNPFRPHRRQVAGRSPSSRRLGSRQHFRSAETCRPVIRGNGPLSLITRMPSYEECPSGSGVTFRALWR